MKILIIVLLLSGCASQPLTTPLFTEDQLLDPQENAVVYFFMTGNEAGCHVCKFDLVANGRHVLYGDSFVEVVLPPGEYNFHTDSGIIDHEYKLTAEPGQVYFLKVEFIHGTWSSGTFINLVQKQEGIKQLVTRHRPN